MATRYQAPSLVSVSGPASASLSAVAMLVTVRAQITRLDHVGRASRSRCHPPPGSPHRLPATSESVDRTQLIVHWPSHWSDSPYPCSAPSSCSVIVSPTAHVTRAVCIVKQRVRLGDVQRWRLGTRHRRWCRCPVRVCVTVRGGDVGDRPCPDHSSGSRRSSVPVSVSPAARKPTPSAGHVRKRRSDPADRPLAVTLVRLAVPVFCTE